MGHAWGSARRAPIAVMPGRPFLPFAVRLSKTKQSWTLFGNGKIYVTMMVVVDIREYHDPSGRSPFREWFDRLNSEE